MKYSLINVYNERGGNVSGVWIQDHSGTLETAKERARRTEAANGNRISVAVVESRPQGDPNYNILTDLIRLA